MSDQIKEYESQLADVEALLQTSPNDPSLQSLSSDLVELINITKQQQQQQQQSDSKPAANFDKALEAAVGTAVGRPDETKTTTTTTTAAAAAGPGTSFADTVEEAAIAAEGIPSTIDTSTTAASEPKKKAKTVAVTKDFEVPQHLIPLDTDTDAERNKKKRALKTLKSKWRERKKEAESTKKQKSWQSFQKKTKKIKASSMFSTSDAAVGVVAASGASRQMTEFGERKRHKPS